MSRLGIWFLTALSMAAFASNSVLCRLALRQTGIDAASFTALRLLSGAAMLCCIVRLSPNAGKTAGSWRSALALFVYAAGFSWAYVSLPAATGALLLFGAVQAGMIGYGAWHGERLRPRQWAGLLTAFGGLAAFLLPGLAAPPLQGALLMLVAGLAWAIYSLRAKGAGKPLLLTKGNFIRALPFAALLSLLTLSRVHIDAAGVAYAVASGALTSGLGYALWYSAVRGLKPATAAAVQLSVPVIAALGGAIFLGEAITPRLLLCSLAILGGIGIVIAS